MAYQAITLAGYLTDDDKVGTQFEQERDKILTHRGPIRTCPAPDEDTKDAWGGITHIEFIAQYLIPTHDKKLAELNAHPGRITLLTNNSKGGLITAVEAQATLNACHHYCPPQLTPQMHKDKIVAAETALHE